MKIENLCLVILTITVTATGIHAENESKPQELSKNKEDKRISKREAILIDSFPVETSFVHSPNVVYRRVSRQRYMKSKPKRGAPRPKYGPPKTSIRPVKKYRGKPVKVKYGPPSMSSKKRPPKPHYGPPKHGKRKPVYGPPKKQQHYQSSYIPQEPVGFGEPPMEYNDYQPTKNYNDPPTDSYGAPLKPLTLANHNYAPDQGYSYDQPASSSFHQQEFFGNNNYHETGYQQWHKDPGLPFKDNVFAHSQKYVNKVKPSIYDATSYKDETEDYNEDDQAGSFTEFYNHKPSYIKDTKKKHHEFVDHHSFVNRPKKVSKPVQKEQIVVGGQYAEPPARYFPKFQPSAPMFAGDDSFTAPKGFADSETAGSVSPYVNYKNSNMAFSPQNLNDAFSIVD